MQVPAHAPESTPFIPYTPAAKGSAAGGTPGSRGALSNDSPTDDKANTPGKMFTQTPPAGRRLDENGKPILVNRGARRKRLGTSPVSTLPVIPPKNSYSYGSTSTGVMSYIKYADTSNSLKELMQEAGKKGSRIEETNEPPAGEAGAEEDPEISEQDEPPLQLEEEPPEHDLVSEAGSGKSGRRKPPRPITQQELEATVRRKGTLRSSAPPDTDPTSTAPKGKVITNTGTGTTPGRKAPGKTKLSTPAPKPKKRQKPQGEPGVEQGRAQSMPPVIEPGRTASHDNDMTFDTTFSHESNSWAFWNTMANQASWFTAVFVRTWGFVKNTGNWLGRMSIYLWFLLQEPLKIFVRVSLWILLFSVIVVATQQYMQGELTEILPPSIQEFSSYIPSFGWPHWAPFRGREGTRFSPPASLPHDFETISKRLSNVERVLQIISDEKSSLHEDFQKANREFYGQLQHLSKSMEMLAQYTNSAKAYTKTLSTENAMATSQINAIGRRYKEVKAQLEKQEKQFKEMQIQSHDTMEKTLLHDGLIRGIRSELESLLPKIEDIMAKNRRLERALNHLQKSLPDTLPVRMGADGKLAIRPEFYQYLKDFYTFEVGDRGGGPGPEIDSADRGARGPYSWNDFLKANEVNLRSYLGQRQKEWWEDATKDELVVSKEQFMAILKDEILRLDQRLSGKVKIQETKLQKEITNQVTTGIKNLEKELIKLGGGKKNLGESLADSLSQNYASKLVDYAAFASGALVDPFRQSSTFSPKPTNRFYRTVEWMFRGDHKVPRARIVLTSTAREPGLCWPFPGKQGHIGIILAQHIYVTDVTMEHIAFTASTFKNTAPKQIDFWIQVTNSTLRDGVYKAAKEAMKLPDKPPRPPRRTNMNDYVKVAGFTYQWGTETPEVQSFSMPLDLRRMGVTVDHVLFSVVDNYGNDDFTCLYRLRVHGLPAGSPKGTKVVEGTRQLD